VFDSYYWVVESQPWFGWPQGFQDTDGNCDTCVEAPGLHTMLWRPGSLSRWAARFNEEYVSLWAPAGAEPVEVVRGYESFTADRPDRFIERHAAVWLNYSDSCCWEIFALDGAMLNAVERHLAGRQDVKCYPTVSQNRRWGFSQVGWDTWPR
jgi:hypothetical protein